MKKMFSSRVARATREGAVSQITTINMVSDGMLQCYYYVDGRPESANKAADAKRQIGITSTETPVAYRPDPVAAPDHWNVSSFINDHCGQQTEYSYAVNVSLEHALDILEARTEDLRRKNKEPYKRFVKFGAAGQYAPIKASRRILKTAAAPMQRRGHLSIVQ